MIKNTTQISLLLGLASFLFFSTGCATAGLPGLAKKADNSAVDNYVAQASSNVVYNTDVNFDSDYQPSPQPGPSYTSPPVRTASQTSGGESESCASGSCH